MEYDEESESWVEAITEAQQLVMDDFDKYDITFDGYQVVEGDGHIRAFDSEGNMVYEDGKFDLEVVFEAALKQNLRPTDVKPNLEALEATGRYIIADRSVYASEFSSFKKELWPRLAEVFGYSLEDLMREAQLKELMIDPLKNSYGFFINIDRNDPNSDQIFSYPLDDESSVDIPLIPNNTLEDINNFWVNREKPSPTP